MIQFKNKTTPSEYFDDILRVVLDGISDNMAQLLQKGKYGCINKSDTTIITYYDVKYISDDFS